MTSREQIEFRYGTLLKLMSADEREAFIDTLVRRENGERIDPNDSRIARYANRAAFSDKVISFDNLLTG